jgi:cyclopropane-fatty-acyl-phospholipid synthase
LASLFQILARNMHSLNQLNRLGSAWTRPIRSLGHWLQRNTRSGSRKNISAHYDLSNDFFRLMLDPSMTYSSGIFSQGTTLEEAQFEKYDRICKKLDLQPQDRVLEIGTGWGGFAEHAVSHYGCHVTTTTISEEQFHYSQRRFSERAMEAKIRLLKQDYRDLEGEYDKLVSIEMVEAVGHQFLGKYFGKCCQLLRPNGAMCLQAITIPDHRYAQYRRSVDFIQRYIFPGGCLPSFSSITRALAKHTDFRFVHSEDFGADYAKTIEHWRRNFWKNIEQVRGLGFDEAWIRIWEYYLCYCIAGFMERQIGVSQVVLARPQACLRS